MTVTHVSGVPGAVPHCGIPHPASLVQTLTMPHQWMEGNLPVSAKCNVCDRTCGSVLRLQDWRCLWCRATVSKVAVPNMHASYAARTVFWKHFFFLTCILQWGLNFSMGNMSRLSGRSDPFSIFFELLCSPVLQKGLQMTSNGPQIFVKQIFCNFSISWHTHLPWVAAEGALLWCWHWCHEVL